MSIKNKNALILEKFFDGEDQGFIDQSQNDSISFYKKYKSALGELLHLRFYTHPLKHPHHRLLDDERLERMSYLPIACQVLTFSMAGLQFRPYDLEIIRDRILQNIDNNNKINLHKEHVFSFNYFLGKSLTLSNPTHSIKLLQNIKNPEMLRSDLTQVFFYRSGYSNSMESIPFRKPQTFMINLALHFDNTYCNIVFESENLRPLLPGKEEIRQLIDHIQGSKFIDDKNFDIEPYSSFLEYCSLSNSQHKPATQRKLNKI